MDPLVEIITERERARQWTDPNVDVCYLATVTAEGWPEVRAIALREIAASGFELLLSRTSPKWQQLSLTGYVSLLIHWATVHRQYRIRGHLEPLAVERVGYYWARKTYSSQLLEQYYDVYRPQSAVIPSRATLLQEMNAVRCDFPEAQEMPIATSLVGVTLVPQEIEAWHGSPDDRLHDRCLYRRTETGWAVQTLVP